MLEIMHDVVHLPVGEGCIIWVCGELYFASDDLSIVWMGAEMADM